MRKPVPRAPSETSLPGEAPITTPLAQPSGDLGFVLQAIYDLNKSVATSSAKLDHLSAQTEKLTAHMLEVKVKDARNRGFVAGFVALFTFVSAAVTYIIGGQLSHLLEIATKILASSGKAPS